MSLVIRKNEGVIVHRGNGSREGMWNSDSTYKFVFSIFGQIKYQLTSSELSIPDNHYILLNPFEDHKQLSVSGEKFLVEINQDVLQQTVQSFHPGLQEYIHFILTTAKNPQVTKWIEFIRDFLLLLNEGDSSYELFTENCITQLALILSKYHLGSHTKVVNTGYITTHAPSLNIVVDALKEGYADQWKIEDMAKLAGLSKYQFIRYFTEKMGISPYSWLQIYRIFVSQRLLRESDKSITEIALSCGFSSTGMFNSLFKRLYRMTPSQFRIMFVKH